MPNFTTAATELKYASGSSWTSGKARQGVYSGTRYEGAIKFCNIAIMGIEENNIQTAHRNIVKVENIIEEFQATLNHKYPVAKDFENVYKYLQERLVEANMKKDKEILEEVLVHLRTMRDTWK